MGVVRVKEPNVKEFNEIKERITKCANWGEVITHMVDRVRNSDLTQWSISNPYRDLGVIVKVTVEKIKEN